MWVLCRDCVLRWGVQNQRALWVGHAMEAQFIFTLTCLWYLHSSPGQVLCSRLLTHPLYLEGSCYISTVNEFLSTVLTARQGCKLKGRCMLPVLTN